MTLQIRPSYSLPIFQTGHIYLIVESDQGERQFAVAHVVRGTTREEQEANIEEGRAGLQRFIDAANRGMEQG